MDPLSIIDIPATAAAAKEVMGGLEVAAGLEAAAGSERAAGLGAAVTGAARRTIAQSLSRRGCRSAA